MAYFGISSAGVALTATVNADTVQFAFPNTAVLSSNTVLGLEGADVIYVGQQGVTATASAGFSGTILASGFGGEGAVSAVLYGSAGTTYANSTGWSVASGGVVGASFGTGIAAIGVVTSQRGARSLVATQLYGNAGNDSIYLGNQASTVSAFTIGGGAGNDVLGTYTYVNQVSAVATSTASTWSAFFVDAGGDADIVNLRFSASTLGNGSIQGSQGNDTIGLFVGSGTFQTAALLGGGGDDVISAFIGTANKATIAGGGGNDTIGFSFSAATASLILGDALDQIGTFDGNDVISGQAGSVISSNTIQGGAGNDTIRLNQLTFAGGNNLIQGALGNDVFSGDTLSADTVQMGAGTDLVTIGSGGTFGSTIIQLGGDNDTVIFTTDDIDSGAGTVYGGFGADLLQSNAAEISSLVINQTFGYAALTESTLSAMDTINFGQNDESTASGTYNFFYSPGSLSLGSFTATAVSGTNGVVVFSAGFDTNLTSRVDAINAGLTTAGATVTFRDGNNVNYLFVQGGNATTTSDDLLIQVESARTASNPTIAIAGGKTVTLNLS